MSLPELWPASAVKPPPIDTIDDLLTRKEMADWLGVTERVLIADYVYGNPPLPFFKHNRHYRFSKRQVAWWYNKMQGEIDPMVLDVRRARREAKRAKQKKL